MSPANIGGTPKPGTARTSKPSVKAPASKKKVAPKPSVSPEVTTSNTAPITVAPLDKIVLPQTPQPRRYFKPEAMQSLINSVNKNGVLQNIVLRPIGDNYELVAGERRYRAAIDAGLKEVPAIIREMTDSEALEFTLTENLQREDLNLLEETEGTLDLLALKLNTNREGVITILNKLSNIQRGKATDNSVREEDKQMINEVFARTTKITPEAFRVHRLPLLNLHPEILEALRTGSIEYTKAKEINKLSSPEDRQELLENTIDMSLSFLEVRKQVLSKKPKSEQPKLQTRLDDAYKQARKSKVWEDPDKQKKLESLLAELEALLSPLDVIDTTS
ncbi:chromosome partitioning protein, ParB family [Rivularia sp. IAM M-261]|nr:chromosome partitioning protein, ParB family [Rivularia sp. IAM M-261]